jgi:hypothetical protein
VRISHVHRRGQDLLDERLLAVPDLQPAVQALDDLGLRLQQVVTPLRQQQPVRVVEHAALVGLQTSVVEGEPQLDVDVVAAGLDRSDLRVQELVQQGVGRGRVADQDGVARDLAERVAPEHDTSLVGVAELRSQQQLGGGRRRGREHGVRGPARRAGRDPQHADTVAVDCRQQLPGRRANDAAHHGHVELLRKGQDAPVGGADGPPGQRAEQARREPAAHEAATRRPGGARSPEVAAAGPPGFGRRSSVGAGHRRVGFRYRPQCRSKRPWATRRTVPGVARVGDFGRAAAWCAMHWQRWASSARRCGRHRTRRAQVNRIGPPAAA